MSEKSAPQPVQKVFSPQRADLAWVAQVLSERAQQQAPSSAQMFVDRGELAIKRLNDLVTAEDAKFQAISDQVDQVSKPEVPPAAPAASVAKGRKRG